MEDRPRAAKDGRRVVVRPVELSDTHALVELSVAVTEAGEGIVMTSQDVRRGEAAEHFTANAISENANGGGVWLLACRADGTGSALCAAGARRLRPSFVSHVASLSIEVHPAAQGLGIGRLLLESVIAWVVTVDPKIERLELYVREDNTRARRLYESCGFRLEGVRKRFIRLPTGVYVDDLIMVRFFS